MLRNKNHESDCNTCIAGCSAKCGLPDYITNKGEKLECFCNDNCKDFLPRKLNLKNMKGGKAK